MLKKIILTIIVAVVAYLILQTGKKKTNSDEVKNLRIVITGASSGIGEELAYQLAEMGARLVITARREYFLQQVVKKCKELGSPEAYYVAVDMNSYESASSVIVEATKRFGGIDILFLNHISASRFGGYDGDVKYIEELMMPNALTHAHMASVSLENLLSNKGRIIVTSSISGLFGNPYLIPYATTKHALNGFFRSLRLELKLNNTDSDLSVSLCHLGYIATKSAQEFQKNVKSHMKPYPLDECVAEMIRGGMAREEDIYYPNFVNYLPLLYSLFHNHVDQDIVNSLIKLA